MISISPDNWWKLIRNILKPIFLACTSPNYWKLNSFNIEFSNFQYWGIISHELTSTSNNNNFLLHSIFEKPCISMFICVYYKQKLIISILDFANHNRILIYTISFYFRRYYKAQKMMEFQIFPISKILTQYSSYVLYDANGIPGIYQIPIIE